VASTSGCEPVMTPGIDVAVKYRRELSHGGEVIDGQRTVGLDDICQLHHWPAGLAGAGLGDPSPGATPAANDCSGWPVADAHTTRPQAAAQQRSTGPERRTSLFRHVTDQTLPHRQNVHHGPHTRCAPPERCYASAWSMSVMGCTVGTPALARCIAQPGLALATASGVWRSISATLRSRICPASSGCSTE
jgi:hypothetical protein